MLTIQAIADGWNQFFHAPLPTTTVSVFRILWGCLLTVNAALHVNRVALYFGPHGLLPSQVHQAVYGKKRFSLFAFLPDDVRSAYFILCFNFAASISLAAGCFTRTSAALVFVTLVSLHHRNPAILHSGDTLLRLITFYLIFSRAGTELSVDSILFPHGSVELSASSPWCERLMQIQICVVYARTALWKMRGKSWPNGTAIHYPLQVDSFRRFDVRPVMSNPATIRIFTWSVLFVEFAFAGLVWIEEYRYWMLVAALCLHFGIETAFNIQLFSWVMIACLLLFVDPVDMQALLHLVGVMAPAAAY